MAINEPEPTAVAIEFELHLLKAILEIPRRFLLIRTPLLISDFVELTALAGDFGLHRMF
jgi:hypothetical protein